MIKLTDEQIQILENNGYEQAPNYYNVENFPWFKELVNDGGISLEIIVNPLNNEQNVLVGCTVESDVGDVYSYTEQHINAKDVFEELVVLKSFGIWQRGKEGNKIMRVRLTVNESGDWAILKAIDNHKVIYECQNHALGDHHWINLLNAIGVSANIEHITDEEMEDMDFEGEQ